MFRRLNDMNRISGTVDLFNSRMTNLADDFTNRQGGFPEGRAWPPTNFYDNDDLIYVYSALPGIRENEISITLHNNLLTIKGHRAERTPAGYTILRQERNADPFSRSFSLPFEIDAEKTRAELKNGILTIKLMKAAAEQPKKIVVQAA